MTLIRKHLTGPESVSWKMDKTSLGELSSRSVVPEIHYSWSRKISLVIRDWIITLPPPVWEGAGSVTAVQDLEETCITLFPPRDKVSSVSYRGSWGTMQYQFVVFLNIIINGRQNKKCNLHLVHKRYSLIYVLFTKPQERVFFWKSFVFEFNRVNKMQRLYTVHWILGY
jgi:hypothetical protein